MRFNHDGISLWYGTPDAPAPGATVFAGKDTLITIGVWPTDTSNRIEVRYRQNQGLVNTITAAHWQNIPARGIHYFRAHLPVFQPGDTVDYSVVCYCAGRQVPDARKLESFASTFVVTADDSLPKKTSTLSTPLLDSKRATVSTISSLRSPANKPEDLSLAKDSVLENQTDLVADEALVHPQNIAGQLIHQETGQPLSNFTIRSFDLWAGAEAKDLGHAITDKQGRFAFVDAAINQQIAGAEEQANRERKLLLQVFNPQACEIHRTEMPLQSVREQTLEIRVDLRAIC